MLFVAQTVAVMGFAMVFPFLPLYVADLGVRSGGSVTLWSGLAYSAQAAVMLVAAPVWGALADRWGRKLMIERALFGGAVTLALMGFARSAEQLVLLRAIQGAITGVIPSANALVAASTPRERSGWAMGLMQASAWTGTSLGPLLGGVLADAAGFRVPFVVTSGLLLASGLAVVRWARDDMAERDETAPSPTNLWRAWRRVVDTASVRRVYAVRFATRLGPFVVLPIMPLLVMQLMPGGARVATMAGVFAATISVFGILGAAWFGRLGDRVGHVPVLLAGCAATALAYVPFLWVDQVWKFVVLAVPVGLAQGAVMPSIAALLARHAPSGGQGAVYGIDASVVAAARMLGPAFGAAAAAVAGLGSAFGVAALAFAAGGLLALGLPRASEVDGSDPA